MRRPKGEGAPFKNDLIVILEPFSQEANSARAVNIKGWKEIKEHLRRTVESARARDWLEWQELMGIHEPSWPRCGPPRIKAINDSDSDDEVEKLGLESKTIIRQLKNFAATPTKEEKEAYDPERNWKLILSQPGREEINSPLIDLSHCKYSEGNCHIDDESVVVWKVEPTEGVNAFWHNSERRCVFKKFATRNGTLYRNGWLSYPPDLA
uniref:Uncharacterized protein n=1 Tax=Meloidogyne javanica TaxID=6303 RepID=A0A915MKR8_MELJA